MAIGGVVVRKTYYYLPTRELKRQAEQHHPLASRIYQVVAYGNSLRSLLWLYIGLTSAASLVLLARELPIWVSLLIVGPLLWIAFSLIPATRLTSVGARLTMLVTPPIAWLLNYLHPILSRAADRVERRYTGATHTKLFERDDLLDLIERQQQQDDNRVSSEELEIAKRALSFDDHRVLDVLISRKKIKTVQADDTIGPILIDELHKSGQDFVLVRESPKGPFIGSLIASQLGINSAGKVRDVMNPTVYYVHENDSLGEALHAFFVTNHPLFVVVNSFEEYVGVITVESMLRQLMGHLPGDDFDQYADPAAVAARHPKHKKTEIDDADSVKTDEEVVE
jgi:CBS domain containing-hemolysin-like protein